MSDAVEVQFSDLERATEALGACLNYFTTQDLARAQLDMAEAHTSPLTQRVAEIKSRFDGLIGDHLFKQYQEQKAAEEIDAEDDVDEPKPVLPEGEETEPEEELNPHPLGKVEVRSRRATLKPEIPSET